MNIVQIPTLSELQFEENSHTYRIDGVELPSVTTIMQPLSSAKYDGIDERIMNKAANRGTVVHNAIENYIKFDIEDIDNEYRGYFDGFLEWWNKENPMLINSESKIYNKLMRYAGTIDLLLEIDSKLCLVDIKTTQVLSDMTCGVQLEAYSQALKSLGINIDRKMILHLKKDGKYDIREYPVNDTIRWKVFGALKTVYDYIHQEK